MAEAGSGLQPVDFDPFATASAREIRLALTEPQAEMWAAAALSREANCAYNQCFVFALDGPLRVESLAAALERVVARHDALRTVFAADGSAQIIRPPFSVAITLVDASDLDLSAQQRELAELLERECETPFDLTEGPLIRAFVVRESALRHRFVLTAHHLVCDGWSSAILFSELGVLYAADRVGIPAQLQEAVSYQDYVTDQDRPECVAELAADEDFWAAQYPSGAPVLDLPLAGDRPAVKTYRSGREHLQIDEELYTALKRTGARSGATLFATLLAAYQVLVYRLSGQPDFVVGIPFAGQTQLENPALVAHCVSTVPLRARLDPSAPFSEHLRSVGRGLADAQGHARLTFGSLVRRLNVPRDRSRTPLVATTFTIDKIGAPFDFGDVTIGALTTPKSYSNFELAMNVVDRGADIVVECDYNADLFDGATLRRWLSHYEVLLRAVVARPDDALHALPLVGEEELSAGSVAAGAPAAGALRCLHEWFGERVLEGSGRLAVVCEGQSLSYGQLDQRANALAWRLRGLGVGPDVLVGLRCERSLDVVVGILGILKAGGAYVPLDPAYPRERVQFMVADSGVAVVVAQEAFVDDVDGVGVRVVVPDADEVAVGPESGVGPEHLAYVIYTSGSTGTPKGVLVSHANVSRLFSATERWFGFGREDVWTLFHSYAFDFSVWEMWGALLYGGRLVVVPYWVSRSPDAFLELVVAEGVTVLNQTPSAFGQLMEADARAAAPRALGLRYVIFGGEALELSGLRGWFSRYGDERPQVVNMYGITETTVHVTYRPIVMADVERGAGSVIGVPLGDLRLLVLDAYGSPVPVGVAGEIYVGGGGVARGYLKRPELTAERFVSDRWPGGDGSKLYRTGDLARWLEDGELEYVGRIDDQVKIRGFRIELGEIEAALAQVDGVGQAVVVVRQDAASDQRLVAYVASADPANSVVEDARRHLKAVLPDYMQPAHILALASLPLTANGKIDRTALPAPDDALEPTGAVDVAPSTSTESVIAAIWLDILTGASPGVHDDFFDVGGDSMKAARIVTALRSTFGVDVGMRHLFERPTIAGLAEIVDVLAVTAAAAADTSGAQREAMDI